MHPSPVASAARSAATVPCCANHSDVELPCPPMDLSPPRHRHLACFLRRAGLPPPQELLSKSGSNSLGHHNPLPYRTRREALRRSESADRELSKFQVRSPELRRLVASPPISACGTATGHGARLLW
uniref:Uncharacterized protein n=1 Tax=Arundo donax TaxID=35708 RepID=A0A0A9GS73_ARUDO